MGLGTEISVPNYDPELRIWFRKQSSLPKIEMKLTIGTKYKASDDVEGYIIKDIVGPDYEVFWTGRNGSIHTGMQPAASLHRNLRYGRWKLLNNFELMRKRRCPLCHGL